MSSPVRVNSSFLRKTVLLRPLVDRAGERRAESREVRAAFVRVDVVDERRRVVVITVVVLDRASTSTPSRVVSKVIGLGWSDLRLPSRYFTNSGEPPLVEEGLLLELSLALVLERDRERFVQERRAHAAGWPAWRSRSASR